MKQIPEGYYAIIFYEQGSKTYGVNFPAYPGIITYGKNFTDAVSMAQEALSVALETEYYREQPLPNSHKPKKMRGKKIVFIPLAPEIRTAYLLRLWREDAGLSQRQLAERLGVSFQAYQRMERPGRSNLTVATLQRIAQALNKSLVLDVRDSNQARLWG